MVQNVDYGWTETVPLRCLCELPPGLGHLPPQVMQAKLAGIQKRPGLQMYPDIVKDMLVAVKKKRKVFQYSTMMSVSHIRQKLNESLFHSSILVWRVYKRGKNEM